MTLSKQAIMEAMDRFDSDGAPTGYGEPKKYWLVHPETGKLYPQKTIYGMAHDLPQSECPSATPTRAKLERLGFEIFDEASASTVFLAGEFQNDVQKAARDTSQTRRERLKLAQKHPDRVLTKLISFRRNPDVVAERLEIAKGICEACSAPAPFRRPSDGTPFLEVHHVVPLANGGEDTVENTQALCPNCHRQAHFG